LTAKTGRPKIKQLQASTAARSWESSTLIIEGYNIHVLDAKTNEDITSKVLTQILLEYGPVRLDLFSNELLTRAIRVNDRLLKDFVDV
jgi:polyhydroxyalkanoate synthesis regulator protein